MIDGVHFGEHLCVVALGIGIDGAKHPLGAGRGLDREHHRGHRSADRAARARPGHDPADLRRHRRRQGAARGGGEGVRPSGDRSLPTAQDPQRGRPAARTAAPPRSSHADACRPTTPTRRWPPRRSSRRWPRSWSKTHPGAAASLREGLAETLTVLRLGVPPTLARTLRSTNCIESMISIAATHSTNVKNWQNGHHGAALVRRRHDRGSRPVPPRQRPPAPARTPRRARARDRRNCPNRPHDEPDRRLTITRTATEVQRSAGHPPGARLRRTCDDRGSPRTGVNGRVNENESRICESGSDDSRWASHPSAQTAQSVEAVQLLISGLGVRFSSRRTVTAGHCRT